MTEKEKAKELVDKFIPHTKVFHEVLGWEDYVDSAKQSALIAVDEIINLDYFSEEGREYWQDVKKEIEKL